MKRDKMDVNSSGNYSPDSDILRAKDLIKSFNRSSDAPEKATENKPSLKIVDIVPSIENANSGNVCNPFAKAGVAENISKSSDDTSILHLKEVIANHSAKLKQVEQDNELNSQPQRIQSFEQMVHGKSVEQTNLEDKSNTELQENIEQAEVEPTQEEPKEEFKSDIPVWDIEERLFVSERKIASVKRVGPGQRNNEPKEEDSTENNQASEEHMSEDMDEDLEGKLESPEMKPKVEPITVSNEELEALELIYSDTNVFDDSSVEQAKIVNLEQEDAFLDETIENVETEDESKYHRTSCLSPEPMFVDPLCQGIIAEIVARDIKKLQELKEAMEESDWVA